MERVRIKVSFLDKAYTVPVYAAKRMHRLKLLMDQYPEAEEFDIEEVDDGKFNKCLETIVPSVDIVGFMPTDLEQSKPMDYTDFADFLNKHKQEGVLEIFPLTSLDGKAPKFAFLKKHNEKDDTPNQIICPSDWWQDAENFEHESVVQETDPYSGRIHSTSVRMFVSFFKLKNIISVLKIKKKITI